MFLFNNVLQRKNALKQLTVISKLHSIAPEIFFNLHETDKRKYKHILERIRILYQDRYNYWIFDNYGIDIIGGISFKKYTFICIAQNIDNGFPIKLDMKHTFSDAILKFLRGTKYDHTYWDRMGDKDKETIILPHIFMDLDSIDLFYRMMINSERFSLLASVLDKYDFILHACAGITILDLCTIIKLMSSTFPDLYMFYFDSADCSLPPAIQPQHSIPPKNFWIISQEEKKDRIKFIEDILRKNTRASSEIIHIFRIPDEKIWLEHSLQLAKYIK